MIAKPMQAAAITTVFDACFAGPAAQAEDRARLVAGGDEPLFVPASRLQPIALVVFARGLAQSALHEAAHWLCAGRERRRLADYGYWYLSDGRDRAAQDRFEQMEIRVQATELLLARAAGVRFVVSADNLCDPTPSPAFVAAIRQQAVALLDGALNPRAHGLLAALCAHSGLPRPTPAMLGPAEALVA